MRYGITNISIAQLRRDPSHKAELLSQLLFGEVFQIISQSEEWFHIQTTNDKFEAWLANNQCNEISKEEYEKCLENSISYSFDKVASAITNAEHIPIVLGSPLPYFDGLSFKLNHKKIIYNGQVLTPSKQQPNFSDLEKIVLRYLNTPFLWGGRSPFGIDAPNFIQIVYKLCGFSVSRELHQLQHIGTIVPFITEANVGDFVMLKSNQDVDHIGILLSPTEIIHPFGKVRIDAIDTHGVFLKEEKIYSHKIDAIKRLG